MSDPIDDFIARRNREKRWHHGIQRYVTLGRKADDLRCVWHVPKGVRITRWLRPENAEATCAAANENWESGRGVVGWFDRAVPTAENQKRST